MCACAPILAAKVGEGDQGSRDPPFVIDMKRGGRSIFGKRNPFFSQCGEEEEANYSWELKEEIRLSALRTIKKYQGEKAHEFRNNFRSDLEA